MCRRIGNGSNAYFLHEFEVENMADSRMHCCSSGSAFGNDISAVDTTVCYFCLNLESNYICT